MTSIIEWASAGSALESESGDLHLVVESPQHALVAVIDGLGHGSEAAIAARAALPVLETYAGEPLGSLIQRCHEALRKTRGVAMSIASLSARDASMSWVGVGNVDATLLRSPQAGGVANEALATRGGVVGFVLPPLRVTSVRLFAGDVLILATDGIRNGFSSRVLTEADPQEIARSILSTHGKASDDALVVVARYLG